MREDEKRLGEYLDAFSKIWVTMVRRGEFMTLADEGARESSKFRLLGARKEEGMCVLLLATYMPTPHILSFFIQRRDIYDTLHINVPEDLKESVLEHEDWASRARIYLSPHTSGGDGMTSTPYTFTNDVLLLNPEDIKPDHYRKHVDKLVHVNGDYRQYLSIYYTEGEWFSLARKVAEEFYSFTVVKEMGIVLSEEEILTSRNPYLLNIRMMKSDLNCLIRIFRLSLVRDEGVDAPDDIYLRPSFYSIYRYRSDLSSRSLDLMNECFISHIGQEKAPTEEQKSTMRCLLPSPVLDINLNIMLCIFFDIDLGRCIVKHLGKRKGDRFPIGNYNWARIIGMWMGYLREGQKVSLKEMWDMEERQIWETERGRRFQCGVGPISETKHRTGRGVWRKYSSCESFVSSLLERCVYPGVAEILHECSTFTRYLTCTYQSFCEFSVEETRNLVSQICQNTLCECHWTDKKLNPEACRTPLFIMAQFGCSLPWLQCCTELFKYTRQGESPINMIIRLQSAHLLDHAIGPIFERESGFRHKNIIALFPIKDAPICEKRDIALRNISDSCHVNIFDVSNYGRTLSDGRFRKNSELRQAIRGAEANARKYKNVARNAREVLRRMIRSDRKVWRKVLKDERGDMDWMYDCDGYQR